MADTSAIPAPVMEREEPFIKGGWDVMNLFGQRNARERRNAEIRQRNFERQQAFDKARQELLLKQISHTNELDALQKGSVIKTGEEVNKIKQLQELLARNSTELLKLQGVSPEEATNRGNIIALGSQVLPEQTSALSNQFKIKMTQGGLSGAEAFGASSVKAADAANAQAIAAANRGAFTNQVAQATDKGVIDSAAAAQIMANKAAEEQKANEVLAHQATTAFDIVEREKANRESDYSKLRFLKENPASNPGVNLPTDYQTPEALRAFKTLSGDNYGPTSAFGLTPQIQRVTVPKGLIPARTAAPRTLGQPVKQAP